MAVQLPVVFSKKIILLYQCGYQVIKKIDKKNEKPKKINIRSEQ